MPLPTIAIAFAVAQTSVQTSTYYYISGGVLLSFLSYFSWSRAEQPKNELSLFKKPHYHVNLDQICEKQAALESTMTQDMIVTSENVLALNDAYLKAKYLVEEDLKQVFEIHIPDYEKNLARIDEITRSLIELIHTQSGYIQKFDERLDRLDAVLQSPKFDAFIQALKQKHAYRAEIKYLESIIMKLLNIGHHMSHQLLENTQTISL